MTTQKLIEGLQILLPYYDNQDGYHCSAGHDVLYALKTDKPLPQEALDRLEELNWRFESDTEAWRAFVWHQYT